jgi:hypothetical protein
MHKGRSESLAPHSLSSSSKTIQKTAEIWYVLILNFNKTVFVNKVCKYLYTTFQRFL